MARDLPPQVRRKPGGIPESGERETRESDFQAFARLFEQAYQKCFSTAFTAPLTESESHQFSVEITESTGLEIGWKSLKNYSNYLLGKTGRVENPSVPTLDTLARYVAGAPATDEAQRRSRERHYPYWFRYKEALRRLEPSETRQEPDPRIAADAAPTVALPRARRSTSFAAAVVAVLAGVLVMLFLAVRQHGARAELFTDEFDDVSGDALARRGWSVQSMDTVHWAQRGGRPGHLTLFTLEGDNWPQSGRESVIRNLLVRRLPSECFVVDVRLTSFFPRQNWQQAGILLLEDTAFAGRSARMSIGFNDFSGGFPQTKEVIVQAITSLGRSSSKPEEVVHQRLFVVEPATEDLIRQNLESTALRIEKHGTRLRLLYSAGPIENAPFKEVGGTEFDFRPAYVAVFALKGFVSESDDILWRTSMHSACRGHRVRRETAAAVVGLRSRRALPGEIVMRSVMLCARVAAATLCSRRITRGTRRRAIRCSMCSTANGISSCWRPWKVGCSTTSTSPRCSSWASRIPAQIRTTMPCARWILRPRPRHRIPARATGRSFSLSLRKS